MYYALVIFSVFIAACAQTLLKKGAQQQYDNFIRQYMNVWVVSGYAIMFLTVFINIFVLSHGVKIKEVSSMESLSYLFVPLLNFFIFKESQTIKQKLAIVIIITGVIIFFL